MRHEEKTARAPGPPRAPKLRSMMSMRPPCVLVAEDDDDLRAVLVAALRADGYDVMEAVSGQEVLDHIGTSMLFASWYPPPDVIVSDVRMPGFTGLDVLAGLREGCWQTPVLLITAYASSETVAEARRLGARIFSKPFDLDDLRTAVMNLVPEEAWKRWATRHLD